MKIVKIFGERYIFAVEIPSSKNKNRKKSREIFEYGILFEIANITNLLI
jgi:hypothetical protein